MISPAPVEARWGGPARSASLGIDVGGTSTKWALVCAATVLASGSVPTAHGPAAVRAELGGLLASVRPETLGLALPGPVSDRSRVDFLPNLPGDWTGNRLVSELATEFDRPIHVVNDGVAHAMAEASARRNDGPNDFVVIILGTGVGGGVVIDGAVHLGVLKRAGELGHLVVDPSGPACVCGNRGCLETFASVTAIRRQVASGSSGSDDHLAGPPLPEILDAAARGDSAALAALHAAGRALGAGISAICAVLAPVAVVIGGGGRVALPWLEPAALSVLARRKPLMDPPRLLPSRCDVHAGAVGAALWARRQAASEDEPSHEGMIL